MLALKHADIADTGNCEVQIRNPDFLYGRAMNASLQLRRSPALRELRIDLLNVAQRKSGPKRLRSNQVRNVMRKILLPFAYFPVLDVLEVGGYDAIEYTEMFDELRASYLREERSFGDFFDECEELQSSSRYR